MEPEAHRDRRLLSALGMPSLRRVARRMGLPAPMRASREELVDAVCKARAAKRAARAKGDNTSDERVASVPGCPEVASELAGAAACPALALVRCIGCEGKCPWLIERYPMAARASRMEGDGCE